MQPHPDFADVTVAEHVVLGRFTLTTLGAADLDADLAAVTAAEPLLVGLFDDAWPRGLTREADLLDLMWHEKEFALRRSFAWVIRDAQGAYLGCAYLFPMPGRRGAGDAAFWFADLPARAELSAAFEPAFRRFLVDLCPDGYRYALRWQ